MEERMIDDEKSRGVRLKKTADGYVDVTDETLETDEEEAVFEFPVLETDEDDEEMVGLTPEQAAEYLREKEAAEKARIEEYARCCAEGDELIKTGSFRAAELKFEKALLLDEKATEASVGYWRAKTADFTQPDVLIEEYANAGIESLAYDLGDEATQIVKEKYKAVFEKRVVELTAEEEPLAKEIEEKRAARREILKDRIKRSLLAFILSAIPAIVTLILAIVFGLSNFTTRESTFIVPTIVSAVAFVAAFITFMVFSNKLVNDCRLRAANEKLSSTEEGVKLLRLRDYKALYLALMEE